MRPKKGGTVLQPNRFDVTAMLDYYTPYVSGLTEAARLTAEGLARRGWKIAVICAQHDPALASHEVINGVHVFRAPVLARVSRGFVSPQLPLLARRLAARSDIVHIHLPNPEAALVAAFKGSAWLVVTHHIDVFLPDSPVNRFGMRAVDQVCMAAVRKADLVITNREDQARGSRLWPTIRRRRLLPIPSPCVDQNGGAPRLRDGDGLHIGFMGRITVDKGIEYLIRTFAASTTPGHAC
jgi:glycosyltransferase involved in cell wall biosynthesis